MLTPQSLPQYDIIVETLTGSELKVTVTEKDTIGYIKSRIQKYEGIPVGHQHLLYNHNELSDTTEMKDVPLVKGSRLKLVLGLKGGPVSARRVVTLPDYENWFDLSDVLNTSRQEPLTISTPGVKVLVYKDCKKNIHRLMKFRTGKNLLTKGSEEHTETTTNESQNDQWLNDNINTLEKMHQLRTKLDWKKRNKNTNKSTIFSGKGDDRMTEYNFPAPSKCNIETEIGRKLRRLGFITKGKSPGASEGATSMECLMKSDGAPSIGRFANSKVDVDAKNWPQQSTEKMNNNSFFNYRHSQQLSLKVARPVTNSINYVIVGGRGKSAKLPNIGEYSKMKLRENIRRNRSFKTINTGGSDMVIDENQVLGGGSVIGGGARVSSSPNIEEHLLRPSSSRMTRDEHLSSTSVQDLIEKFSESRISSLSDPCGVSDKEDDKEKKVNKRSILSKHLKASSFENKLFVEHQHSYAINNRGGESRASCSSDFQLDSSANADTAYRVFKLPSENANNYELPKLLIREDSPVESFHSSDSQLETLALRGESPKTVLDPYGKINAGDESNNEDDQKVSSTESILQLYDAASTKNSRGNMLKMLDKTSSGGASSGAAMKKMSSGEIEMTNLELNFLNDDLTLDECDDVDDGGNACGGLMNLQKCRDDCLKVSNDVNDWKAISPTDFDKQSLPSSTSFNFMSSGDISPTEDDDDVFNSCEMLHPGKSKSVEMNELHVMFGSSPTLLNNYTNGGVNSQMGGVPAAPFIYRRHADTCLSSSTSDLECLPARKAEIGGGTCGKGHELPSLLRHRNNEHLDYVRSYENLDRTKIVRLKNEKIPTVSGVEREWKMFQGENGGDLMPRQESSEDFSAFTRLNYHNHHHHHHHVNGVGATSDFPISFPSNESLFNINFDTFEDDVIEIDTMSMFDANNQTTGLILPDITDAQVKFAMKQQTAGSSKCTDGGNVRKETSAIDAAEGGSSLMAASTTTAVAGTSSSSSSSSTMSVRKSKKLRCAECNKKLGLIMIMRCHCEKVFCPQHRYAEAHNCSYNFKQEGRKILARENPLVVAQKLPKI
ncbi:Ubiquitin-like domain-containing protein [Sergentomyia squamirostris]